MGVILITVNIQVMPKIEAGAIPLVTSGTTTATTTSKVVDSTQNFLSTVSIGDLVRNTTDSTFALVTAIDSDTILSVGDDVFETAEDYVIENGLAPQSFLIDGVSFQRGGYEIAREGDIIGISRLGAQRISNDFIEDPVIFSDWDDSTDTPFASVAAFITAVEQFFYRS